MREKVIERKCLKMSTLYTIYPNINYANYTLSSNSEYYATPTIDSYARYLYFYLPKYYLFIQ